MNAYEPSLTTLFSPSSGLMATVTSGFYFQYGFSYYDSIITTSVKCTVVELDAFDRQRDGQMGGQIAGFLNAPYLGIIQNKKATVTAQTVDVINT